MQANFLRTAGAIHVRRPRQVPPFLPSPLQSPFRILAQLHRRSRPRLTTSNTLHHQREPSNRPLVTPRSSSCPSWRFDAAQSPLPRHCCVLLLSSCYRSLYGPTHPTIIVALNPSLLSLVFFALFSLSLSSSCRPEIIHCTLRYRI